MIYDTGLSEKRIIVYAYFATKRGADNTVGFSCDDIVEWAGYKHDYHPSATDEKFYEIIMNLSSNGFFSIHGLLQKKLFVRAELNTDRFVVEDNFALIYIDELKKLRNFKQYTTDTTKMSTSILLLTLCYIRVNMLRRQANYHGKESRRPEFCYRVYKNIAIDIGISHRYISRAVKILCEMDLIACSTLPRWKDAFGNWHTSVTLFANKYRYKKCDKEDKYIIDKSYNYIQELQWGADFVLRNKKLNKIE